MTWFKPEWLALAVNVVCTGYYLVLWWMGVAEPGKLLYWVGSTILVAGLILMKG